MHRGQDLGLHTRLVGFGLSLTAPVSGLPRFVRGLFAYSAASHHLTAHFSPPSLMAETVAA
jgi:hypothetical protein